LALTLIMIHRSISAESIPLSILKLGRHKRVPIAISKATPAISSIE
jgi:hypothetical protein